MNRQLLPLEPFFSGLSLVIGDSTTGKSLFVKYLAEQAIRAKHSVCILDPNGDHADLCKLGAVVFNASGLLPNEEQIQQLSMACSTGFVLELSGLSQIKQTEYLHKSIAALQFGRTKNLKPDFIIVDEAHKLILDTKPILQPNFLKGVCLSTFNPSILPIEWIAEITTLVTDSSGVYEIQKLLRLDTVPSFISSCLDLIGTQLESDAYVVVSRDSEKPYLVSKSLIGKGISIPHVRQKQKFWNGHLPKAKCFYFLEPYNLSSIAVDNLQEFCKVIVDLESTMFIHHLEHRDYSRWARNVIDDSELTQQLYTIEGKIENESISVLKSMIKTCVESRYLIKALD